MKTTGKNYSIFSHVIHSRLQLMKDRIEANPGMSVQEMVSLNLKQFEVISDAIDTFHHYKAGKTDYMNAAELFLSTLNDGQREIENQPVWRPKSHVK